MSKFWIVAALQFLAAVAVSAFWFWWTHRAWMAAPPEPYSDLYAHDWGFQWLVYCVTWLPVTLVGTLTLVLVERAVLKSRAKKPQVVDGGS